MFDIFSAPKVLDKAGDIIEVAEHGIGRLFFTDKDKSDASAKYFDTWLDIQKVLATENTNSAISRRILAWLITGTFLFLIVLAVAVYKWAPEWSKYIFTEALSRLEFGFGAVITTYFVTGGIAKVLTANKGGDAGK